MKTNKLILALILGSIAQSSVYGMEATSGAASTKEIGTLGRAYGATCLWAARSLNNPTYYKGFGLGINLASYLFYKTPAVEEGKDVTTVKKDARTLFAFKAARFAGLTTDACKEGTEFLQAESEKNGHKKSTLNPIENGALTMSKFSAKIDQDMIEDLGWKLFHPRFLAGTITGFASTAAYSNTPGISWIASKILWLGKKLTAFATSVEDIGEKANSASPSTI
jgi:hypothetical protein